MASSWQRTRSTPGGASAQVAGGAVVEVGGLVVVLVVMGETGTVDEVVVETGVVEDVLVEAAAVEDVAETTAVVLVVDVEVGAIVVAGTVDVLAPVVVVLDACAAVVDVVGVVVVVVVVVQPTPQHGSDGSWVTVGAGVTVAVPRTVGGVVLHESATSLVPVTVPAIVMPVLPFRKMLPLGGAPGPVQTSCPVAVIAI